MVKMVLELPSGIERALAQVAERSGRSCTDVIHQALLTFLNEQERVGQAGPYPLPLSAGLGADTELNAADIDDLLAANWRPEDDRVRD